MIDFSRGMAWHFPGCSFSIPDFPKGPSYSKQQLLSFRTVLGHTAGLPKLQPLPEEVPPGLGHGEMFGPGWLGHGKNTVELGEEMPC